MTPPLRITVAVLAVSSVGFICVREPEGKEHRYLVRRRKAVAK